MSARARVWLPLSLVEISLTRIQRPQTSVRREQWTERRALEGKIKKRESAVVQLESQWLQEVLCNVPCLIPDFKCSLVMTES